nr:hypothetical protein [Tanacetum cinerariifolium]
MRIPLLYRGEYSQWSERFMNYLEEQTDGEAMINSIKNGDQPLPRVTQVLIAGTSSTKQPHLKDKSMWSDQEKKIQKIDRLARSLLIHGLPNDIYSLIDSNKTAKDLWDALSRQMLGSKYGEQDRKAAVLYEYETFKATEGELLLDTYICYLQVINDLKKCSYSKDNCELNFKFLNNLQPEWKQYATMMRQNKNLMDINIDALYNILKQNQGDNNDAMGLKKKTVVKVLSDSKKSSSSSDETIAGVLYYTSESKSKSEFETSEYYDKSTNYSLFVDNGDDQEIFHDSSEHFSENHIGSQMDYDQSAAADHNDFEEKIKLINQLIKECDKKTAKYQKHQATSFKEKNNELNEQIKVLIEKNDDLLAQTNVLQEQLKVKYVMIDTHVECHAKYDKLEAERYEYMIRYSAYFDNDKKYRKQIDDQEILFDKMSRPLVEMDENVRMLKNKVLENNLKIYSLEGCVRNKDLEIEKCLERLNDSENKLHKIGQTNQTIHMIMPSKDKMFNGQKGIGFENPSYFCKAKHLRPMLYDERVIGLGKGIGFENPRYFEKAKDLRPTLYDEKEIINPDFEKIDSPFQQTSSLKPYVPNVILQKIIIDLEDEVVNLLEKKSKFGNN